MENIVESPGIVLGYPLSVTSTRGRKDVNAILELISYEQFAVEIQRYSSKLDDYEAVSFRSASGIPYNHWLGLFVNESHFRSARQHIENSLSIIANRSADGSVANEFNPKHVIKVLLPLMNKFVVSLLNGQMHESESAILAYCHYLRLLLRFVRLYPSKLVPYIHEAVSNFFAKPEQRSKDYTPDIGEFLILLAIHPLIQPGSKYSYYNAEHQKCILQEYFARQVLWIDRAVKKIHMLRNSTERLRRSFDASAVSNKLLVFNLMMCKTFIFPGVEANLDANYCLPPVRIIESFQGTIKRIKAIANYSELLRAISYSHVIDTPEKMISFLDDAVALSYNRGYTNFY